MILLLKIITVWVIIRMIIRAVSAFLEELRNVARKYYQDQIQAMVERIIPDMNKHDLFDLRNYFHACLTASTDPDNYRFFLNIIGIIDERIYFLQEQERRASR